MSPYFWVGTHVATFCLSGVMWRWIIFRELRALVADKETPRMTNPLPPETPAGEQRERRQVSAPMVVLAVILAGFLIIVGFGIQQVAFQRSQDRHDACVDAWGQSLISNVTTVRAANRGLAQATTARDTARARWEGSFGAIVDTILAAGKHPTPQERAHFAHVLREAGRASTALERAQRAVDRATQNVVTSGTDNPLPPLHCGH